MSVSDEQKQQYNEYVKQVTPTHSLPREMLHAFFTGGVICTLGQLITSLVMQAGVDQETAGTWCSILLILLSVVLTGLNIYPAIAASAIEYKKEGQVFGIGCKIFTIAGPVILYGVFTSWVLGFLYWLGKGLGI